MAVYSRIGEIGKISNQEGLEGVSLKYKDKAGLDCVTFFAVQSPQLIEKMNTFKQGELVKVDHENGIMVEIVAKTQTSDQKRGFDPTISKLNRETTLYQECLQVAVALLRFHTPSDKSYSQAEATHQLLECTDRLYSHALAKVSSSTTVSDAP